MFGLSKEQMMDEPLEDILINQQIDQYLQLKAQKDNAIMEQKTKRGLMK